MILIQFVPFQTYSSVCRWPTEQSWLRTRSHTSAASSSGQQNSTAGMSRCRWSSPPTHPKHLGEVQAGLALAVVQQAPAYVVGHPLYVVQEHRQLVANVIHRTDSLHTPAPSCGRMPRTYRLW